MSGAWRRVRAGVLACGSCTALLAAQELPRFTAGTRMVQVDVHVSRAGQPVAGLQAEDFEVLDDGARQAVELVAWGSVPIQPALLLDTSGSVTGARLAQLRAAARTFLDRLGPADRPLLATFSHEVRLAAPLGSDRAALRAALDGVTPGGSTALFDALYAGLALRAPRGLRPVLVVFSDGENRLSWLTPEKVLAAARISDTVVYAVQSERAVPSWNDPTLPAPRRQLGDAPALLADLARETGGRVWPADDARLEQAFLAALTEIKSRYLLRYEPPASARPGWHRLEVRLRRGQGEVRTRRGFWLRPEAD